jgi:hypothetical protein
MALINHVGLLIPREVFTVIVEFWELWNNLALHRARMLIFGAFQPLDSTQQNPLIWASSSTLSILVYGNGFGKHG